MQYIVYLILIIFFTSCSNKEQNVNDINSLITLKTFIEDGQKNGYIPKKVLESTAHFSPYRLNPIDLEKRSIIEWNSNSECTDSGSKIVVALDNKDHSIICNNGDALYITGAGNDFIHDAVGNDIFYTGEGNDTIETSYGSDIFIFDKNWGHDKITFNPNTVEIDKIIGYDGSYPWKYSSFIVFGKQVNRSDIVWHENTLVHTITGDTIELNSKKINIVFANEIERDTIDKNFIPPQKIQKKVTFDEMRGESILIRNNLAYLADKEMKIIDLADFKNPILLSETFLTGEAISIKVINNIAYVAQAAKFRSEGAGGWVSIINIEDPTNPKILHTLKFGNSIHNIALGGKYLYVADTNFSYPEKRSLFVYDISKPTDPVLMSETKLKHYSRFIAYSNNFLFLSTFKNKLVAFDINNPKHPYEIPMNFQFEKKIQDILGYDNKIIINQDGNTLSVFETIKAQSIMHLCDIKTPLDNKFSSINSNALFLKNNTLFRAELNNGVSIIDLNDCEVKKVIKFHDLLVKSVGVFENILFAINEKKIGLYDLVNQCFYSDCQNKP